MSFILNLEKTFADICGVLLTHLQEYLFRSPTLRELISYSHKQNNFAALMEMPISREDIKICSEKYKVQSSAMNYF